MGIHEGAFVAVFIESLGPEEPLASDVLVGPEAVFIDRTRSAASAPELVLVGPEEPLA